jgi:hypothetical protein
MPPQTPTRYSSAARLFRFALAASLTLSALFSFLWSWRWPLVGDTSLMHYIVFLIHRGWAPYRDLGDMNMPGSYLIEMAAMRLFGPGALAWRLFDFTLLAAASASFFAITTNRGAPFVTASSSRVGSRWLPGLFAASLFILIHGRDGLAQGGQRDLTMAVCLIAATAFLFRAVRRRALWPAAAFGLLSGVAVTIKPTALLLTLAELVLALYTLHKSAIPTDAQPGRSKPPRFWPQFTASAAIAYLVFPATALIFLIRHHALAAFLEGLRTTVPYYASLGHRPLGYVLLHSLSPTLPLVLLWLAILALDPTLRRATLHRSLDYQRSMLLAGVLFGLINCVLQARALPYYRYPLLAFLLPLMALDFTAAISPPSGAPSFPALSERVGSTIPRYLAFAAFILGAFFLAPQSAILIHRFRWQQTDFIASLQQDLTALGGQRLSGRIQCIDTNSGCGNVLYLMRLEPSTGVLSDFFLFGPGPEGAESPVVRRTRYRFSSAILANPPQVIVVTSRLYLGGSDNFAKLDGWPAFQSFLASRYTLKTQWTPTRAERWWSREEYPAAYRIYVLRTSNLAP